MLIREAIVLFTTILGGIMAVIIYVLPSYLAFKRKHINKVAILIINILLGWTLIGYVLVLVWAIFGEGQGKFTRKQI